MKEKRVSVEARERVRQRIAQWEGLGVKSTKEVLSPTQDPPRTTALRKLSNDVFNQFSSAEENCVTNGSVEKKVETCLPPPPCTVDGDVTPIEAPPPAEATSPGQDGGMKELEDPLDCSLLRDQTSLRYTTPVRNAAVKRFWQQQVNAFIMLIYAVQGLIEVSVPSLVAFNMLMNFWLAATKGIVR